MNSNEMLQFALSNGIIDKGTLEEQVIMKMREKYLSMHNHRIWLGKDGYWRTYLPTGSSGRKLVRKTKKDALEDTIIEFYKNQNNINFKECYFEWLDRLTTLGRSDNTIVKYQTEYKRFFGGYDIENVSIDKLDDDVLSKHYLQVLKSKDIPFRAFRASLSSIDNVFQYCVKKRYVKMDANPCIYLDAQLFRKYCKERAIKTAQERTVSKEEANKLVKTINKRMEEETTFMLTYVTLMSLYTGMRVGELAGLMWSDIDFEHGIINIQHSERKNRKTGEYTVSDTKNHLKRSFPLTGEIRDLLHSVREVQKKYNVESEFVFANKSGKVHCDRITWYLEQITKNSSFSGMKSIQALRRTLNSNLKSIGVPSTVAASLLGHTEKVNEMNYTYDVTDAKTKMAYLKKVNESIFTNN